MAKRTRPALRATAVAAKSVTVPVKPYISPSRREKRGVTFYLEPEVWMQLRMLSVTSDQPIGKLMEQAVQSLLSKHGRAGSA